MARTWSVPHRGSFASLAGSAPRQNPRVKAFLDATSRDARRGPLLLLSALLTVLGIAVLNFDSQSLATFLLVAGAGLAASLILLSERHAMPDGGTPDQRKVAGPMRAPSQFSELLVQPQSNPNSDRAAWAKLTAHMSHELRTPLNAVLGFSEIMSKEVFGPLGSSCYGDYARDIHASGRLLLKSAEDALAITALLTAPARKGPPPSGHLESILDDACTFARCDLEARSISLEVTADTGLEIIGDPQATRQMLINLIGEASRDACSGAVVRIEARSTSDCVTLSVTLSGQRSVETSSGDGFAMILARTLCELSNAHLQTTATAEGGHGWTVRFLVPTQSDLFLKCA